MSEKFYKYIELQPVVMEGSPDAHIVIFKVTNQQFVVSRYGHETKEDAEWYRRMFCVALEKVVEDAMRDSTVARGQGKP